MAIVVSWIVMAVICFDVRISDQVCLATRSRNSFLLCRMRKLDFAVGVSRSAPGNSPSRYRLTPTALVLLNSFTWVIFEWRSRSPEFRNSGDLSIRNFTFWERFANFWERWRLVVNRYQRIHSDCHSAKSSRESFFVTQKISAEIEIESRSALQIGSHGIPVISVV
jgi:hypothetical protein